MTASTADAPRALPAIAEPAVSFRALMMLGIFLVAIGVGVAIAFLQAPPATASVDNPYPALPVAAEPAAAATFVKALVDNDIAAVAATLPDAQLQVLGAWLDPVVEIDRAAFVGAVERDGETIAGYVINGRNAEGAELVVGLTLAVRDGKVVGIK